MVLSEPIVGSWATPVKQMSESLDESLRNLGGRVMLMIRLNCIVGSHDGS